MKKFIFALLALCVMSCSESHKSKMEKVIKDRMEKDYLTYEPLKFGESIDTIYTTLEEATNAWMESYNSYKFEYDLAMMKKDLVLAEHWIQAMKKASAKLDSIENAFYPKLKGYAITHTFKVDDETHTMTFLLNPELTKVYY